MGNCETTIKPLHAGLSLHLGSWAALVEPAKLVRYAVFVKEQAVPIEMELDEFDAVSTHAVIFSTVESRVAAEAASDSTAVSVEAELESVTEAELEAGQAEGEKSAAARALATGRLLPDGHIGRMAVMADARGLGLGAQVLQALIDEARRQGMTEVVLSAQLHAMGFYQRFGFVAEGDVYLDCAIEHKDMRLKL